jgi:zinc/manganese transport system permease protein
MFAPFMLNTWYSATIVAIVAGAIGFFIVLRGASFLAHAIPHGAFAGAAGAVLIGLDPLIGMGVFALGGAVVISTLGRRGRPDVVIALSLVTMLGLGALFLSFGTEYSAEVFALLFGQILGISSPELIPILILGIICLAGLVLIYRPLLYNSVLPEISAARGINPGLTSLAFTILVAIGATLSVPIVGALLMFSLLVGPAAAARAFTRRPSSAIAISVVLAIVTVWVGIALAYVSDLPVGFFVTAISAVLYGVARLVKLVSRASQSVPKRAFPPAAVSQRPTVLHDVE